MIRDAVTGRRVLLLAAILAMGCDPAWHHRIVVREVPDRDESPAAARPLAGALITYACPNHPDYAPVSVATDDAGEAFLGGLGYGLPRDCTVAVSKSGFVPRQYQVADYCYEWQTREARPKDKPCREAVLTADLQPEAKPAPAPAAPSCPEPPAAPGERGCKWPRFEQTILQGRGPFVLRERGCSDPPDATLELLSGKDVVATLDVGQSLVSPGFTIGEPRQGPIHFGDAWMIDLPLTRPEKLKGVVVLLYRESTHRLVIAGKAGPYGEAFDYRLVDLDDDGVPELRLRTASSGEAVPKAPGTRTFKLSGDGFHEVYWEEAFRGRLAHVAPLACHAYPGPLCDPAIDYELVERETKEGSLLFFTGRTATHCAQGGCHVAIVWAPKSGAPALLSSDFGELEFIDVPGQPGPCFSIAARGPDLAQAVPVRSCFEQGRLVPAP